MAELRRGSTMDGKPLETVEGANSKDAIVLKNARDYTTATRTELLGTINASAGKSEGMNWKIRMGAL